MDVDGAIVVFAKCPTPGASKTRLAPLLGSEGAASLAKAMLCDVLISISGCPLLRNTLKVLMYAPATESAKSQMISILHSLRLPQRKFSGDFAAEDIRVDSEGWVLLPMISNHQNQHKSNVHAMKSDLNSSSLGDKLADALEKTRGLIRGMNARKNTHSDSNKVTCSSTPNESVLFLGMDSPELPIEEIVYGLSIANGKQLSTSYKAMKSSNNVQSGKDSRAELILGKAHLCPANDGGYGLLSVPNHAPSSIFEGVRWSNPLTAISQLKAITDAKIDVSIGKLMYDVDEPQDVEELAKRLVKVKNEKCKQMDDKCNENKDKDVLRKFSFSVASVPFASAANDCAHTWKALSDLGIIKQKTDDGSVETAISKVNDDMFSSLH